MDMSETTRSPAQCNYSLNPYVLPGTKILPASKQ